MMSYKCYNSKKGRIFLAFLLLFFQIIQCQNKQFIEKLNFKSNYGIHNFSNNPYKLITECVFDKTLNGEIIWGFRKISNNYEFTSLNINKNKTTKFYIDFNTLKNNISSKNYDDLTFYGISSILKTETSTIVNEGNVFYVFKSGINNNLLFKKQININDSIEFSSAFAITDSTVVLLDYRSKFKNNQKVKAYILNLNTEWITLFFEEVMGSNSASFDRSGTRYFDAGKSNFIISDNLDFKIYVFDKTGSLLSTYNKELVITTENRRILNQTKVRSTTFDSVMTELDITPRILNTQFINDTDIIVNYSIKKAITNNGVKIKNSMVDLVTVRRNNLIYKNTFDDTFIYEQTNFNKLQAVKQSSMNPYLRSELFYFAQNNYLIKFTFKQLIPKSKTKFGTYIRKAKLSILNLKSNLIYSVYEFNN